MRRTLSLAAALLFVALLAGPARGEDPFAKGADALAVAESDGSSSLRAKMKLTKMEPDMVMAQVVGVDDSKFPDCVVLAKVLKRRRPRRSTSRRSCAARTTASRRC